MNNINVIIEYITDLIKVLKTLSYNIIENIVLAIELMSSYVYRISSTINMMEMVRMASVIYLIAYVIHMEPTQTLFPISIYDYSTWYVTALKSMYHGLKTIGWDVKYAFESTIDYVRDTARVSDELVENKNKIIKMEKAMEDVVKQVIMNNEQHVKNIHDIMTKYQKEIEEMRQNNELERQKLRNMISNLESQVKYFSMKSTKESIPWLSYVMMGVGLGVQYYSDNQIKKALEINRDNDVKLSEIWKMVNRSRAGVDNSVLSALRNMPSPELDR